MDEKKIKALVELLLDKSEDEREQTFEALGIPDDEREEIRRRISEFKGPPKGLSSEELPENKHFRQLVTLARRGMAILFVGAGVSVDVGMPSTTRLLDALKAEAKELGVEIPPNALFPEAARIVESAIGRQDMVEVLHQEFERALKADPPPYRKGAYHLLAALPKEFTKVLVTTNWDNLLCRAFEDAGESAIEIFEGAQSRQIPLAEHAIVKLHGGFENPEGMIVTETDYKSTEKQIRTGRIVGTLWSYVSSLLAQYSFIFIGYSLGDPHFRLLRYMVEIEMKAQPSPHFFIAPLSHADEEALSRLADVRPISATATNFLLALFRELDEFANRQDELDMIFKRQSSPFIEFYGPFGSGKTALLDHAERQAKMTGWLPRQVVRVNWDRRHNGTLRNPIKNRPEIFQILNEDLKPSIPLKRFEDFASYLRDKEGVLLIFDATQHVQNQRDLVSLLSDVVAPAIQEMNEQGQRSKLLLAGRFPLKGWPYRFRRNFLPRALTPFDASTVREMARKFLLVTDPDSQERFEPELIADILEVSSGHALFIKTILADLTSEKRRHEGRIRLPRRFTEEEKRKYVSQFNGEIDKHISWENKELKKAYEETLCVFRWLNREIVGELGLPTGDPLSKLAAIYVLSPQDFSNDPVIRRIKMLRLKYEQFEKFVEAHRKAQRLFATGVEQLVHPVQLDYILEWLFHTAHLLIAEKPKAKEEERCKALVKQIEEQVKYRAYLGRIRGESIGAQLVRRITEDRELWNLLEKCIGQEGIERALEVLEKKEVLNVGRG